MTAYKITPASVETIATSRAEFGKASVALVTACAGLIKVLQFERIESQMIPASKRPKVTDIKEAIRLEFGAVSKEANRQAYDLASLAFRIAAKIEKEAPAIHAELGKREPVWIADQISALAGAATVDAWRDWAAGVKKETVEKSPFDKITAYFEKMSPELTDAQLVTLSEMLTAATVQRERVAQEIADRNAELAA